ncbi:hypothetical protein OMAG_000248 [Candidatus Omnitrophus magneticus]|uniref:Polysaccharide deacetylase n=1 Tax=Candidatus Omnitrophus magneticus TaxID=1609969 RepID=A0A0F0CV34_9BACT|nr:hypothetical protein OMAG_000248 [Candidatus Omnitrophus magneticus]
MKFGKINEIQPALSHTWEKTIFITFDIEWVTDEIFDWVLNKINQSGIKATLFCTHYTDKLQTAKSNNNIELGIHPNFNYLLNGNFRYGKNIDEVITFYKNIVPEGTSYRSHCLTQSTILTRAFEKHGLKYDCNSFIPVYGYNYTLEPWLDFGGEIIKAPMFWEDDIHCMYKWPFDLKLFMKHAGLKIFNFHPVTLLLNINDMDKYNQAKPFYNDIAKLKELKNTGYGVSNFFDEIIQYVKKTPDIL